MTTAQATQQRLRPAGPAATVTGAATTMIPTFHRTTCAACVVVAWIAALTHLRRPAARGVPLDPRLASPCSPPITVKCRVHQAAVTVHIPRLVQWFRNRTITAATISLSTLGRSRTCRRWMSALLLRVRQRRARPTTSHSRSERMGKARGAIAAARAGRRRRTITAMKKRAVLTCASNVMAPRVGAARSQPISSPRL